MREILFKAKRKDSDEWVKGYYLKSYNKKEKLVDYIFIPFRIKKEKDGGWIEIDVKTLCQYTGLIDKKGNKIFEGDILKGFDYPYYSDGDYNYYAIVKWCDDYKYFYLYTIKNTESKVRGISTGNIELFEEFDNNKWEVIGNIFDNPDLLEGE